MTSSTENQAWTIPASASAVSDLIKVSREIPTPGPNQVLIKLQAASLNFRDLLISIRSPQYPGHHAPDLVPGSDGAGTIHSTGPSSSWAGLEGTLVVPHASTWLHGDVTHLRADQIFGGYANDGTLQHWMVVDDERAVRAPEGWTAAESAALMTAGATAWAAIRDGLDGRFNGEVGEWKGDWKTRRLEGKWVLTQGTGGVSCAAIQIAAALGATVIATSSSDAKLELAKTLGATHVINYKNTPEWEKEVLRLTDGRGVDQVIEVAGNSTIMKSLTSVRIGGLVSVIGILTAPEPVAAELVPTLLFGAKTMKGCTAFSVDATNELVRFAEANNMKPVIAKTFAFDQIVEAFEALQSQEEVGKVVVTMQ